MVIILVMLAISLREAEFISRVTRWVHAMLFRSSSNTPYAAAVYLLQAYSGLTDLSLFLSMFLEGAVVILGSLMLVLDVRLLCMH